MKNRISILFILMLLVVGFVSQAQVKKRESNEVKRMIWPANDAAKKIKFNRVDYKDAPAIVIYQKQFYSYSKRGGARVFYEDYFRKRILILDQATLKEYSKFKIKREFKRYHSTNEVEIHYFNAKIKKPNGKVIKIDIKKNTIEKDGKYEIAIPNLEIGDILDYYYYNFDKYKSKYGYTFNSHQISFNNRYPVLKQDIELNVGKRFYLNFNNYNGAPDLVKLKSKNKDQTRYLISKSNIKPRNTKSWIFPLIAYPNVRFQVYFSPAERKKGHVNGFLAQGKGSSLKRTVSKEEVLEKYKDAFVFNRQKRLKYKKIATATKKKEKIQQFYNYLRSESIGNDISDYIRRKTTGQTGFYFNFPSYHKNSNEFFSIMADFLHKNDISYRMILVKSRINGGIKDLLFKQNLFTVMKAKVGKNEYMYILPLSFNQEYSMLRIAGDFDSYLEDNTAYELKPDKKGRMVGIKITKTPKSNADANMVKKNIEISLNDNLKKISVSRNITAKGNIKAAYQKSILNIYDIYEGDLETQKKKKKYINHSKKATKKRKSRKKAYAAYKSKLYQKMKEVLNDYAEETYDIESTNYDYGIDVSGMNYKHPVFAYHDSFTVTKGLTKKAGRNIIFLAGKLIGNQLHVEDKERNRTEDIYKARTSTAVNKITINIPEGYKVKGLSKFNKSIKNEVGSFESTAKVEGNKLIINVKESYYNLFEPNANWQKMLDILDASYQFTQEKILLKK